MTLEEEDWRPSAALRTLQVRSRLLCALRSFFDDRQFCEVETPLISRDCCIDAWIEPFRVQIDAANDEWGSPVYLQSSPEFAMKRLVCAGADRIYQLSRAFRQGEVGRVHNPEFTMLEWYQRDSTYHDQMNLVEELVRAIARRAQKEQALADSRAEFLARPMRRVSYEEAFAAGTGLSAANATLTELADAARSHGLHMDGATRLDRDGLLNALLEAAVEPQLKHSGAVFLYDFPPSQAALARIRPEQMPVAERFELYLDGMEICNGYQELTDAEELQARMERQNQVRIQAGKTALPIESRLLQAQRAGLPECSGVALGFDRLVMFLLGLNRIEEVLPFPWNRA